MSGILWLGDPLVDVLIIGAGLIGVSLGLALRRQGAAVLILDGA
jgi:2-polyprenyl-6-methoxyphenol hydroxylase-like FAD-dependent oxidoreductase